ncbi:MAG: carbohydrate-binding protein, partial [Sphingobacteriaceae bacterium]
TGDSKKFNEITATVNAPQGKHDLYFVYPKKNALNKNLIVIDWVRFGK